MSITAVWPIKNHLTSLEQTRSVTEACKHSASQKRRSRLTRHLTLSSHLWQKRMIRQLMPSWLVVSPKVDRTQRTIYRWAVCRVWSPYRVSPIAKTESAQMEKTCFLLVKLTISHCFNSLLRATQWPILRQTSTILSMRSTSLVSY